MPETAERDYFDIYTDDLNGTPQRCHEFGEWYFPFVSALASEYAGGPVLDIGPGWGAQLLPMLRAGWDVSGLEANPRFITDNPFRALHGKLHEGRFEDAERVFQGQHFSLIHSHMVLEHLPPEKVHSALSAVRALLRPDGMFIGIYSSEDYPGDDPTHICMKPEHWWLEAVARAGLHLWPHRMDVARAWPGYRDDWSIIVAGKQPEMIESIPSMGLGHSGAESKPGKALAVQFNHGLGDCAGMAMILRMYADMGYDVTVTTETHKRAIFAHAGLPIEDANPVESHPWLEPARYDGRSPDYWQVNKAFLGVGTFGLPPVVKDSALWAHLCATEANSMIWANEQERRSVRWPARDSSDWVNTHLATLRRPITLLHSHGESLADSKDMPAGVPTAIGRAVVDDVGGTIVWLDRHAGRETFQDTHAVHLTDWGDGTVEQLLALINAADLVVGIDSGPFHMARLTRTPSLGIWTHHSPVNYAIPSPRTVNVILPRGQTDAALELIRVPYNIVRAPTMEDITGAVRAMLAPPRFLTPDRIGEDVALAQWVRRET